MDFPLILSSHARYHGFLGHQRRGTSIHILMAIPPEKVGGIAARELVKNPKF